MKTYPIKTINLEQAIEMQYRLVDCISDEFNGFEILQTGDLGVHPRNNQPLTTHKVERVFANFFETEDAVLVRGSGTGAIREALASVHRPGEQLLVHNSEIYSTTQTTIEHMDYSVVRADFNDIYNLKETLNNNKNIKTCLIQYTRQEIHDSYDMKEIIQIIKDFNLDINIVTDDNYAVMKVENTGAQLGADLSAFSLFKLLGPEGLGLVIGNKKYIDKIREFHYSGGSQVQGFEAMDAMKSLVYAPVQLSLQSKVIEELSDYLNSGEIKEIDKAVVAYAQSKVILLKFKDKIAKKVLQEAVNFGAAPYPVGAESKYEITPMFYRLSGTMRKNNKEFEDYWIRINPMKSGVKTVIKILKESLKKVNNVLE